MTLRKEACKMIGYKIIPDGGLGAHRVNVYDAQRLTLLGYQMFKSGIGDVVCKFHATDDDVSEGKIKFVFGHWQELACIEVEEHYQLGIKVGDIVYPFSALPSYSSEDLIQDGTWELFSVTSLPETADEHVRFKFHGIYFSINKGDDAENYTVSITSGSGSVTSLADSEAVIYNYGFTFTSSYPFPLDILGVRMAGTLAAQVADNTAAIQNIQEYLGAGLLESRFIGR